MKILLFDINPDTAASLCEMLEHKGHAVWIAQGARHVVELAGTTNFDTCLFDLDVPPHGAQHLVSILRENYADWRDTRTIAWSGRYPEEWPALPDGFSCFLLKPASLEEVLCAMYDIPVANPLEGSSNRSGVRPDQRA